MRRLQIANAMCLWPRTCTPFLSHGYSPSLGQGMITGLLVRSCAEMSRALQAGEANTSPVEASVKHLTVAALDCGAPCPPVSSHLRAEARARRGPGALPRYSYSPCQTAQSSSFPRRVVAPGFCLSLFHPPP